ncbi:Nicastrin [Ooceraea biroi]|uniref:Nicastrin n=1 Tax=Ooceraea biroi TaxID=2015173 RepID=A0A026VXX7_OOCBI|nr:Nicastrin [Ooceraea biroi]
MNAKCTRFHAASTSGAKLINQILLLYVCVHRAPNAATTLTGQLLVLLTGEKLSDMNETTCHKTRLAWMGGYNFTEMCINSTVNYSTAVSPAFIIDGYNMKSESIWQTLSVRMFLKPLAATERFGMILGSLVASTLIILENRRLLGTCRGPHINDQCSMAPDPFQVLTNKTKEEVLLET